MGPGSRRALRERFDDADHPAPQRLPRTHHREWYLATDASMCGQTATVGAILETPTGRRVGRWTREIPAPDNNAAELSALHYGLDRAAVVMAPTDRLGVLIDHDGLARAVASCATPHARPPARPPCRSASVHHWAGIRARIATVADVRVGLTTSHENPAHLVARGGMASTSDAVGQR